MDATYEADDAAADDLEGLGLDQLPLCLGHRGLDRKLSVISFPIHNSTLP